MVFTIFYKTFSDFVFYFQQVTVCYLLKIKNIWKCLVKNNKQQYKQKQTTEEEKNERKPHHQWWVGRGDHPMRKCCALLSSRLAVLLLHVVLNECLAFYSAIWIPTEVVYWHWLQCCLVIKRLVPGETVAVSVRSVYTIQITAIHHVPSLHAKRL